MDDEERRYQEVGQLSSLSISQESRLLPGGFKCNPGRVEKRKEEYYYSSENVSSVLDDILSNKVSPVHVMVLLAPVFLDSS